MSRRRVAVLLLVHLIFALHMLDWASTGRTLGLFEPSESMEFSKHSIVNVGLLFFGGLILSTLLLGRFFCGWACHLVALQDLCRWLMLRVGITPRPLRSRALAWVPFIAGGYMFLWPLAYRIGVGADLGIQGSEFTTQDVWATMPGPWVGLATLVVCGFVCVYFLGSKGFCTYACPYGAAFALADRFAPVRIRVNDACEGCGHCTQVCTSNVDVKREVATFGMVVDTGCMRCLDCVSVCPKDALSLSPGRPALLKHLPSKGRLTWPEEGLLVVGFSLTFYATRGLYDLVPFLFALGLAGCMAFLLLRSLQLFTKPVVRLGSWTLKEAGERRPGAWILLAATTGLSAALLASLRVQWLGSQSAAAFVPLEEARLNWFTSARPEVDGALQTQAEHARLLASQAVDASWLDDPRRLLELGWSSLVLGDVETFESSLVRAQAAAPRSGAPAVDRAHQARVEGRIEDALELLRDAVRADPDLHEAWAELIPLAAEQGALDDAIADVQRGLGWRPADGRLLDLLGSLRMAQGDGAAAEVALSRAVEVEPHLVAPRIKLSQVLALRGQPQRAQEVLREGIRLHPEDPSLRAALQALQASGRP